MNVCRTINELKLLQSAWKNANQTVAFVPTMGNLHEGHLTLCRHAKQRAERVVASIFVNPLQFGPNEDFQAYPRTESADLEKLAALPIDAVFMPEVAELFPKNKISSTQILVNPSLSNDLCGKSRPGHFAGVTTIVAKLFHILQPQLAIFGEKDYQQLTLLRQMVRDLNIPVTIDSVPTVRETDGLALSSRNVYLSAAERKMAPKLYESLYQIKQAVLAGQNDFTTLIDQAMHALTAANFSVDYVELRCAKTLSKCGDGISPGIVLAAAKLGRTRLIDNLLIN